jgi:hypothetical protein
MIEPGNRTEFRSGRMEMMSGISTGPSGALLFAIQVSSPIMATYGCFPLSSR